MSESHDLMKQGGVTLPSEIRIPFLSSNLRQKALFGALIILWTIFTITTRGQFISPRNQSNLFRQMTILAFIAIGMQFVILTGNIDITGGVVAGFASILSSSLQTLLLSFRGSGHLGIFNLQPGQTGIIVTVITVFAALAFGGLYGLFQGWQVGVLKLPSFIVSIGNALILVGLLPFATLGQRPTGVDETLIFLGQGYLGRGTGITLAVLIVISYGIIRYMDRRQREIHHIDNQRWTREITKFLGFAALAALYVVYIANGYRGFQVPVLLLLIFLAYLQYLLTGTRFGIRCVAIGYSASVAGFAGISVRGHIVKTYVLSGMMASMAGIVLTGYTTFGTFGDTTTLGFSALSACLLGIIGLRRDNYAVLGAALGALMLGAIENWMVLVDMAPFFKEIARGGLLITVGFSAYKTGTGIRYGGIESRGTGRSVAKE